MHALELVSAIDIEALEKSRNRDPSLRWKTHQTEFQRGSRKVEQRIQKRSFGIREGLTFCDVDDYSA
jgi:hypothetical protein